VVYFFLKVVFISPVDNSLGGNFNVNVTNNVTMTNVCSDKILTGNITDIDREALVNITYS